MNPTTKIQEIIAQLEALSDPERLKMARKSYPTSLKVIGVTVPNIRPIEKELNKELKPLPPEEVIAFAQAANATGVFEMQQIAFDLIEHNKTAQRTLSLEDIYVFGNVLDNWVSVDTFAGYLAGPAWREGQIGDGIVEEWAVSNDRWWRRTAVVCTVALNQKARGGSGDSERTLNICKLVAADQDDMVAKALSWALRELAKREERPVVDFVDQYEQVLPKRVVREVRRKISTGRKN